MRGNSTEEIAAHVARATESIQAARELTKSGHFDFAASRAYYAAFYAATALLLSEGLEFKKHSGVIAAIHQRFVKSGHLSQELGKNLNWLFELRDIGDYGVTLHIQKEEAQKAIEAAELFFHAVKQLLKK